MDLNISVEEKAWQYAIDKANAAAKLISDAEQARLPEKDRVEFKPVTLWQYVQSRVDDCGRSYSGQRLGDMKALLDREDPVVLERIAKVLLGSPKTREAFAAQIDAL